MPRPSLRPLGWLPVLLAALTILPNYTANVWAQQAPLPPFLADGAYRRYLAPGEIVWLLEVHPDRQLIWQAQTGFYFRLSGGFFGGTPQGVPQGPLQERLAMGQVGKIGQQVTAADIRNYIAVHHVGAIMTSQVPWDWILKIRAAVGSRGMNPQGHVRLFRLADPFSLPPGPVRSPVRQESWFGAAHRLPHLPPGRPGRPHRRARPHRPARPKGKLGQPHHRARLPASRAALRRAHRPTGKRRSP